MEQLSSALLRKMYYIECPVDRSDSIKIFLDLIARGHLRFYGTDNQRDPETVIFRICLPEALRYGLPADMISSSYPIYDQRYARYVDFSLSIRRNLALDPGLTLVTDIVTIMWDPKLEKFVGRLMFNHQDDFAKKLRTGEVLRYLGFPRDFFMEYSIVFQQLANDEYVFETTSDIWK